MISKVLTVRKHGGTTSETAGAAEGGGGGFRKEQPANTHTTH